MVSPSPATLFRSRNLVGREPLRPWQASQGRSGLSLGIGPSCRFDLEGPGRFAELVNGNNHGVAAADPDDLYVGEIESN